MRMRRFFKTGAVVASLALALAACGGDDDTSTDTDTGTEAAADLELVTEDTLTVCTDSPYKPMEFEQDGEFTGFDIELMRAIASELGLESTEVINSGFDGITSGSVFAAGQCDIAAASITITEEREGNVDFTDPYFKADQSLLVKADSDISSLEDFSGQRLGVQTGTTGEAYAQENAPDDAEIVSFDNPGDLFTALEADDIQGILQDLVVNQGRTLDDDSVQVVETYPTDEQYGFATPEGDQGDALLEAVNEALGTLMEDGTYDEIFNEWFPNTDPQG